MIYINNFYQNFLLYLLLIFFILVLSKKISLTVVISKSFTQIGKIKETFVKKKKKKPWLIIMNKDKKSFIN